MNIYNPITDKWNIDQNDYLKRHDIVFNAPAEDPLRGIPIGDGDRGYLIYTDGSKLVINVNKTDLWDENGADDFVMWDDNNIENHTVLRNGGVFTLDFSMPVFETIYQNNYEARLSIGNAVASAVSETPFSNVNLMAYASRKNKVCVLKMSSELSEKSRISISLKRWGSRSFMGWYITERKKTETGLSGTRSFFDDNIMFITQRLKKRYFCIAVLNSSDEFVYKEINTHEVCSEVFSEKIDIELYITVECEKTEEEAIKQARDNLIKARAEGKQKNYDEHIKMWKNFYSKSRISIDNDCLENLWYLNLYYANSSFNGPYPPQFCNGIWGFQHDFMPWVYYFHYNMQLGTFPLETANHPELLETYFSWRKNGLEPAKQFCKKHKNIEGAFYADVTDKSGNPDAGVKNNCSCGALIAHSMYRHYKYTMNQNFLNKTALPVMRETAKMYMEMLKKEEDGYYHFHKTQAYEASPLYDDSITDLSAARALFGDLYEATGEEIYNHYLTELAPYTTLEMEADEHKNGKYLWGIGKNSDICGTRIMSVGKESDSGVFERRNYGNPANITLSSFPDVEMAPVYPSGVLGLADEGTEIFNAMVNQINLHPDCKRPQKVSLYGEDECPENLCMHWCLLPIYMARMGMGDKLTELLIDTASTWLVYPQGMGTEGPYELHADAGINRWKHYPVRIADNDETVNGAMWRFRHFDYETLPIISEAINEMLIQSYDGVIRILPAAPDMNNTAYTLAASGGFKVSVQRTDGSVGISIYSAYGGKCVLKKIDGLSGKIQVFSCGELVDEFAADTELKKSEKVWVFDTQSGRRYVLCENAEIFGTDMPEIYTNSKPKKMGDMMLGIESEY